MAKSATNLQIETARRELHRAISAVVDAFEELHPYPGWEEEREWERNNPSPRRAHAKLVDEIKSELELSADALVLKLKMGAIDSSEAYAETRALLDQFQERRLAYLNEAGPS